MPLSSNLKTAYRSLFRRKIKNISAILAIFLGVTLLIGVQITSATLSESFLTSLTLSQGEVDIQISSGSTGDYLNSSDSNLVKELVPEAGGIMPILLTNGPVQYESQFEESVDYAGIPLNYSRTFGNFYNLNGEIMDIESMLSSEDSVIISKSLATNLDIKTEAFTTGQIKTQFSNISLNGFLNLTSLKPVLNYSVDKFPHNFIIRGIYDSKPGIGSQESSSSGRIVTSIENLQNLLRWTDPQTKPINLNNTQIIPNPLNFTDFTVVVPLEFEYTATDKISYFFVAFKGDHFTTGEWEKEELQVYFDYATENNPMVNLYYTNGSMVLNQDGTPKLANYFTISSSRLTFYSIIGFISNLLNTFLNVLGILIITTGLLLITNIQLMSVEDREFQTGVLRAVGDNKRGILVKYLIETVVQGLVGGFLGLFGGLIFGWTVAFYLSGLFGTGSGSVNPIIPPELVFLSLFLGVLIAIITGIFPAIRASNVNIVEALRGIKTEFSDKSSRNLMLLGVFISLIGLRFILDNGLFNTDNQYIWDTAGWNSIAEQENIVLGLGVFLSGLSIVLTRFIDRIKALNIMAITLWGLPIYSYLVTLKWVDANSGSSFSSFLLITIIEIVIGSVLFLGINLSPFMDVLRNFLIRFNVSKGIAQVAPNLIKSHKTRSTLTFAIFAVILTLNVTIATMVATQSQQTVGQANEDSRGVDLYVKLSEPEVTTHSYKTLIQNLDSRITDVIPFRTCTQCIKAGEPFIVSLRDPTSQNYNPNTDVLPMQIIETTKSQIIGNISENQPIVDQKWRYDFYLASDIVNGFPEDVREKFKDSMNDDQKNLLSKESWNLLFNESYSMTAYNISSLADFGGDNGGGFGSFNQELTEALKIKDENNKTVKNPIVFTDSFILPVGIQIWLPMNGSGFETKFQRFTVGGNLDSQRAGGFPFSPQQFGSGGFSDISVVGSILLPEQWAKYTAYFGDATGATAKRDPMAYDKFMIKTSLSIDDPKILDIAIAVEEFTNTPNQGYQQLIGDDLIQASAITIYSSLSETLEAMNQITSFLQIYVSFGLVIGSLGMAIIAVRNVAERKREIGMMRAIGFPRSQVMLAVLLELFVLGIIGLIIGIVNGLLINYGLSELSGGAIVVPWNTIIIYLGFITVVATIAGALPGWFAARIPASEALRYVG